MKISEAIARLEAHQARYGDLELIMFIESFTATGRRKITRYHVKDISPCSNEDHELIVAGAEDPD